MTALIGKIWLFIMLWTGYSVYTKYEEHSEALRIAQDELPTIHAQIVKKQKEKKDLENYFADIEEAKEKIEKVANEIERLQQQFPAEISDTDNLSMISSLAEILNIKQIFLSPGMEEDKGFYFTKLYNVKAAGTYLQLLIFLEKIGEAKRLLNVHDMKLTKIEKKQKGRFQLINVEMNIGVYRYNPNYKESRGIDEIEKASKESTIPKRRNRKKGGNED
ncbi:MAG: type 4a pilus biogenesis protein PilO [Bdellovibrio sp.]|nr:type 4a pilus biogenesis protein PilO [Bdellovibrio sp.]